MTKLYLLARKFHRYLVIIIILLSILMAGTGIILRYPAQITNVFNSINLSYIRFLHGQISTYFTITLILMSLTGAVLYIYPLWQQRKNNKKIN